MLSGPPACCGEPGYLHLEQDDARAPNPCAKRSVQADVDVIDIAADTSPLLTGVLQQQQPAVVMRLLRPEQEFAPVSLDHRCRAELVL